MHLGAGPSFLLLLPGKSKCKNGVTINANELPDFIKNHFKKKLKKVGVHVHWLSIQY